jgi:hypothetical protein
VGDPGLEIPALLALGITTGGPSPANELIDEALMSYMRVVIKERARFPNEGLRINIVFHVPGPLFQPDYEGVHATRIDRKNGRVLVVAAVPADLRFEEASAYFAHVLREARQKAIERAGKRKVAASSENVSSLIDHLLSGIEAEDS